jgi:UDPglucose 6-dehydrogenase
MEKKVKLGIIGNGFVGNAIYQGMKNDYDVLVHDIDPKRSLNTFAEIDEQKMIFVCVPTPMTPEGGFDICILNSAIEALSADKILIIKSTITPDSAMALIESFPEHRLVFNPEFLTERTAVHDFQNPSRIVLGGNDQYSVRKVEKMYRIVFPSRLIEIIKTDAKTACFIKYFSNCFFAAKVSLMNEFRQIADAEEVDWDVAINGLLSSGWVNPMHTLVPGPDGHFGFGGKCFPKDINAFISYSRGLGINPIMLQAAWNKNKKVRKDSNWLHIEGAISNKRSKK